VEKFPSSKFADEAESLRAEIERNQKKLLDEKAKDSEKADFEAFRRSMTAVLEAKDEATRKEEYAKSLDAYRSFQEKYPNSAFLDDADKLFEDYEAKFKEN
jgi:hypothetical protein